jgi:L-lactate dehydrogenase complex protein LldG
MSNARENILIRLRNQRPEAKPAIQQNVDYPKREVNARIARFTERQQAVRGEVHHLEDGDWLNWLKVELPQRGLEKVLVGNGELGQHISQSGISVKYYQYAIETWKDELFNNIDVAITGCKGAIAETGSLILWPDANEPRLMSLVPPVHIVLLHTNQLYNTFADVLAEQQWHQSMPTNALLISGPSKTADIEQTLAYGIHGPKELVTLIVN